MKGIIWILSWTALFSAMAANADSQKAMLFWPQWRGPLADGNAPMADPPLTWNETQHVKWKLQIPGEGTATPIVWNDRVFLLSAIATGKKPNDGTGASQASTEIYQFAIFCLDRDSGRILWQRVAREVAPHEGHHPDHGYASASPITDGESVFAYFGSRGLYCYDFDGHLKWEKDFGPMRTKNGFGEASSPVQAENIVIINRDHEGDDFIVALDKHTGKELWRTPRDEPTGWSTPLIVTNAGKSQIIVNATGKVRSYDLTTGKEIWQCGGQTANAIPSPVASGDTVYVTSGFRGNALFALPLDRQGDLTGTDAIRWSHNKNTPYVPSPLLVDSLLYTITSNNNVLSCFNARNGEVFFEGEKLEGLSGVYASPVSARDRVYILGRNGVCLVVKKGPKLEVLARNSVEDKTDASLALVEGDLFIRGHRSLYCINSGKP